MNLELLVSLNLVGLEAFIPKRHAIDQQVAGHLVGETCRYKRPAG
jgi:hypothetical protein